MVYAHVLQECQTILRNADVNTAAFASRLQTLRTTIDTHLWGDALRTYYISKAVSSAFAQTSNALAIPAGVNTNASHSTEAIFTSLGTLIQPAWPLAFSDGAFTVRFQPIISPYASVFHLREALAAGNETSALTLLNSIW